MVLIRLQDVPELGLLDRCCEDRISPARGRIARFGRQNGRFIFRRDTRKAPDPRVARKPGRSRRLRAKQSADGRSTRSKKTPATRPDRRDERAHARVTSFPADFKDRHAGVSFFTCDFDACRHAEECGYGLRRAWRQDRHPPGGTPNPASARRVLNPAAGTGEPTPDARPVILERIRAATGAAE